MRHGKRINDLLGGSTSGRTLALDGHSDRLRLAAEPDHRVDTVVSAQALAAADDVTMMLDEIRRVLRPGGRLVFVEPVASPVGSLRRRLQWALGPLWRQAVGLETPPRDLWNDLRAARFAQLRLESFTQPGLLGLRIPHLAGVAVTAAVPRAVGLDTIAPSLNASSPRLLTPPPRRFFG